MKSEGRLRELASQVGMYVDDDDGGFICADDGFQSVDIADALRAFYHLAFKDGVDSCE